MNKVLSLILQANDVRETLSIATQIGRQLRGGEVIELTSDLGGGKTVFVKGLAKGANSLDDVTSPTFTISKIYHCPKLTIYHFDFYRLDNPGVITLELQEIMQDPNNVIVTEWAGIIENILPTNRLCVTIDRLDDDRRRLTIGLPKQLAYLIAGLKGC